ncbi:hypothetical protein DPMN_040640 [Dreissena polymorpha]|uniref:Uncharacterized protein n=1 Tax=Dreissena polymorpha TaxID=45954 RepID=A0A9D4HTA3_DREPO|nr:hypothetical protein DPMN_040640 [Dreissena polymorpha]
MIQLSARPPLAAKVEVVGPISAGCWGSDNVLQILGRLLIVFRPISVVRAPRVQVDLLIHL